MYETLIKVLSDRKMLCEQEILNLYEKIRKFQMNKEIQRYLVPSINIDGLLNFLEEKYPNSSVLERIKGIKRLHELCLIMNQENSTINYESFKQEIVDLGLLSDDILQVLLKNLNTLGRIEIDLIDNKLIKESYEMIRSKTSVLLVSELNKIIDELVSSLRYGDSEEIEFNNCLKALENYKSEVERIIYYLTLVSVDGILKTFKDSTELKKFFDYLRKLDSEDIDIYSIVIDVCKYNVDNFSHGIVSSKELEEVNKNKEEVNKDIIDITSESPKEEKTEDIESLLNDDEKRIYLVIKEIINRWHVNSDVGIVKEILDGDYTLNERKNIYMEGGSIQWDIVVLDIVQVLIPNIKDNKERIFQIFDFIVKLYEKYIAALKEYNTLRDCISKILEIQQNKKILNSYKVLPPNTKVLYNTIITHFKKNNDDTAITLAASVDSKKTKAYFMLLNSLLSLSDMLEFVDDEIKSGTFLNDDLQDLSSAFQEYKSEYEKSKQAYDLEISSTKEEPTEVIDEFSDMKKLENLLCFLYDDYDYSDKLASELKQSLIKLANVPWPVLRKDIKHILSQVWRTNSTGKKEFYTGEHFDVWRIKGNASTRTGLLRVDICEENALKIKNKYNLLDVPSQIIIVLHSIEVNGADHSAYNKVITKSVSDEEIRVLEFVSIFNNPDTPEEELFKCVENGYRQYIKIINDQYSGGAKKL